MWRTMLVALVVAVAWLPAAAGSLSVNPVRIELTANHPTTTVQITNQAAEPVLVQVHAVEWRLDANDEVELPTDDLILNPPIFTIAPGARQFLRLGPRHMPKSDREITYRLIVEEVPTQATQVAGLRTLLRISLPIFILPATSVAPQVVWAAARMPGGGLLVTAVNHGNRHVQIRELLVSTQEVAEPQVVIRRAYYLLPNERRNWEVHDRKLNSLGSVRVVAITDAGEMNAPLRVTQ